MNLVNCDENCLYQQDGQCNLPSSAPISSVFTSDCRYFCEKSGDMHKANKYEQKNVSNFGEYFH